MAITPIFSDNFESYTANTAPGGSWVEDDAGTDWKVQTAPSGLSGQALRHTQLSGSDDYITVTWTRQTSGLLTVAGTFKAPSSGRGGLLYLFDNGNTVLVAGAQMFSDYFRVQASTSVQLTATVADKVYAFALTVDISAAKVKQCIVNNVTYDNSGSGWSWFTGYGTPGGIDRLKLSAYSPDGSSGYVWLDDVAVYKGLPDKSTQTVARQAVTRAATR